MGVSGDDGSGYNTILWSCMYLYVMYMGNKRNGNVIRECIPFSMKHGRVQPLAFQCCLSCYYTYLCDWRGCPAVCTPQVP